jgi:Ca-activated chloride channel family protein
MLPQNQHPGGDEMKGLSFGLVVAVLILQIATAQTNSSAQKAQKQDEQTISVDVDLVNVLFAVTDKKGKFIRDLKKDQFKAYEDGHPQKITNFSAEADLPLTVALLIDTSGSVRDRLRFEQEAAIDFFYSTLIRGKDRALVFSFDSAVELVQDYTDDPMKLSDSIRKMRAGGGTALNDAVYQAATQKLARQNGRRVIVLISDGDDNSSRFSVTEALEAAQRNDAAIFTISTNSSGLGGQKDSRGDKTLRRFASETGGKLFSPFKLQDLSTNFRDIAEELRAQYTLAYRPSNSARDGSFRRIRIDVDDKRYVVRARNGYYAPRGTAVAPSERNGF